MSLFGSSPPEAAGGDDAIPGATEARLARGRSSLFDGDRRQPDSRPSSSLFAEDAYDSSGNNNNSSNNNNNILGDESRSDTPWDMPTPRRPKARADILRRLVPTSRAPERYADAFDAAAEGAPAVTAAGLARTLAAAKLSPDYQARIMALIAPAVGGSDDGSVGGGDDALSLGRNEFNVLLALIGLAQEGEVASLDGVDERRNNLPIPVLVGLIQEPSAPELPSPGDAATTTPPAVDTSPHGPAQPRRAAEPYDKPFLSSSPQQRQPQQLSRSFGRGAPMDYPEDPWNATEVHKNHAHAQDQAPDPPAKPQDNPATPGPISLKGEGDPNPDVHEHANGNHRLPYPAEPNPMMPQRTTSAYTTNPAGAGSVASRQSTTAAVGTGQRASWGYFDGNPAAAAAGAPSPRRSGLPGRSALSGDGPGSTGGGQSAVPTPSRTIGNGRVGSVPEENVVVVLMPEKEGIFLFQHHNYEVSSVRRGSKVIRRYSDFVWLLDCLHKRYPFRALPLLPPKRVAVNGNHLSNDGAFIEKRRRGLARFLNALVRHPVLCQEQLVIMFMTVPTELSVWRKQSTISVQEEFTGRPLPAGLEESLPPTLEGLFERTRAGVKRSSELYIALCNIMDRLVKRTEGVAADHARVALSLESLTEASADVYATDTNDVPLLNDGLVTSGKHMRTAQLLLEDEARAWDAGVLEDLKRQRDSLVSVRDMFDRRERLDRDSIPALERRIQSNETKLTAIRARGHEAPAKPGEVERLVENIIKDKEGIVNQHNRSVLVRECIRDELICFQSTQYHVSRWNQDWAQERVKYAEMLADNWRRLLDGLDGMPLGD